ncbi:MAG TPA: glycosyl hydrolase family 28-related protein [Gemmatimonadaceae bacterium]
MLRSRPACAGFMLAAALAGCGDHDSPASPLRSPSTTVGAGLPVEVSSTDQLVAALTSPGPARNIVLAPGTYVISSPLEIPDGTTLQGSGAMTFDDISRLPAGFDLATRTVIKAAGTLVGDVVVMGDRTTLKGLAIEDAAGRTGGSVVVVHSRRPGDHVEAAIDECEIINPNPTSNSPQSVGGRALVLLTRNRETITSELAPEIGAAVTVTMSHSIISSPRIAGIFLNNFSPLATTRLILTENVIGGGAQVTGGTSRPDAVYGSSSSMESKGNLYRADPGSSPINGLQIYGGAGLPVPGVAVEATNGNTANFRSLNDRVEGFINAIVARGASRPLASPAELSFNIATLDLHGTRLSSVRGDLNLAGAGSLVAGSWPDAGNGLHALLEGVRGSGMRSNAYANVLGPAPGSFGEGNRLEVVGTLQAFTHTNENIFPPPPTQFFTGSN